MPRTLIASTLLTLALLALPARAADPFDGRDIEQLRKVIKPTAEESKWLEIPWQISLWEARQLAAREGKPILLWEMDGNPLGCT